MRRYPDGERSYARPERAAGGGRPRKAGPATEPARQRGPRPGLEAERAHDDGHSAAGKPAGSSKAALRATMTAADIVPAPPYRQTVGDYVGLCLLVQFPDVPGDDHAGSRWTRSATSTGTPVRQQRVGATTTSWTSRTASCATPTSSRPTTRPSTTARYYTDPTIPYGTRARELIGEALDRPRGPRLRLLRADARTTAALSTRSTSSTPGRGSTTGRRACGRTPGPWRRRTAASAGKAFYDYQITDMGAAADAGDVLPRERPHDLRLPRPVRLRQRVATGSASTA